MGWHFMTEFNVSDPDLYWIPPIRIQWSSESRIQIQELKRVKKHGIKHDLFNLPFLTIQQLKIKEKAGSGTGFIIYTGFGSV